MALVVPFAGHRVAIEVLLVDGRHRLRLGETTLREGSNGRFVGLSEGRQRALQDVLRGERSAEGYVKDLKRSVDVRLAASRLLGRRAEPVCAELLSRAHSEEAGAAPASSL